MSHPAVTTVSTLIDALFVFGWVMLVAGCLGAGVIAIAWQLAKWAERRMG